MQFHSYDELSSWLNTPPPAGQRHVPTTREALEHYRDALDACLTGRLAQTTKGMQALMVAILAIDPHPDALHPALDPLFTEIMQLDLDLTIAHDNLARTGTGQCDHDHAATPTPGVAALGRALLSLAAECTGPDLDDLLRTHRPTLLKGFDRLDDEIRPLAGVLDPLEARGDHPRRAAFAAWRQGVTGWAKRSAAVRTSLTGFTDLEWRLQNAAAYPNVRCERGPGVAPRLYDSLIEQLHAGSEPGRLLRWLVAYAATLDGRPTTVQLKGASVLIGLEDWRVEPGTSGQRDDRITAVLRIGLGDSRESSVTLQITHDPEPDVHLRLTIVGIEL